MAESFYFKESGTNNIAVGNDPELPPPGNWELVDEASAEKQRVVNSQNFEKLKADADAEVGAANELALQSQKDDIASALSELLGDESAAKRVAEILVFQNPNSERE